MASRVRTDCTKDEALAPSNTRTATERGHKTAPQRRRKSDNSELIMASVSESMMAPAVLKPPRPVTESRYLRRKGARGGRVDLLWLPSACKDNEARRTRQRASSLNDAAQWPPTARSSQCGWAAHRFGVVLACTDDSSHRTLSSTVAFATEGCCADQWSDRLEMVEIPGEVRAEEGGRGARGAKEVRPTRGPGRERTASCTRGSRGPSNRRSLARATLPDGILTGLNPVGLATGPLGNRCAAVNHEV